MQSENHRVAREEKKTFFLEKGIACLCEPHTDKFLQH
jgi:hypothetical protein